MAFNKPSFSGSLRTSELKSNFPECFSEYRRSVQYSVPNWMFFPLKCRLLTSASETPISRDISPQYSGFTSFLNIKPSRALNNIKDGCFGYIAEYSSISGRIVFSDEGNCAANEAISSNALL